MQKTGVFATDEEFETLKGIASRGWREGDRMIVFSCREGIQRDEATWDAKKACHQVALNHGLPEIPGYYGIDMNKEFVRV